jgi:hypothetical protein
MPHAAGIGVGAFLYPKFDGTEGETNRVAAQAVLRAFEQDWLALAQSSSKLLE